MSWRDTTSPGQADKRIAASFGAVVLLLSLTAAGLASRLYLNLQSEEEDRLTKALSAIVSEAISQVTFSGKHHARLLVEDLLKRVPELSFISVETGDGRVLAHSDPSLNDTLLPEKEMKESRESIRTGSPMLSEIRAGNGVVKVVVVPYRGGFDLQTVGTVRVGVRVAATRQAQQATLYTLLWLVAALTLGAFTAVYFLSRRFGGTMRMLGWQLQGILEHAPLGVTISDRQGRILARSAELEQLVGPSAENESLSAVLKRSLPESVSRSLEDMEGSVFAYGGKIERDLTVETGGGLRSWHVTMFPIARDAAGSFFQSCSLIHDITERKQAEVALRESEQRFRDIFNSVSDAIFVHDARNGRILDVNDRACDMYGYSREEMAELDVESLSSGVPPFTQAEAELHLQEALQGQARPFEWQAKDKDGRVFWVLVSMGTVKNAAGTQVLVSAQNIDERKRMQEFLVQTEKMMSIGGLAAGMAHEINNPLSAVVQSIQVVQNRLTQASPVNLAAAQASGCQFEAIKAFLEAREITSLLQGVRDAGARAAKIVSSMLEFSRKTDSGSAPVNVNSLMDKAVELCASDYDLNKKYDFRKIVIERDFDANIPLVPCTATQIEQVLMNLLRNAAQAMVASEKAGRSPRIILRTMRKGDSACIVVEDNGPGMDKETQRKIFEPFYTTKGVGEGTGLGLSVSYFIIVNNHGGTIEVDSTPGVGTRFVIRLPLEERKN